MRRVRQESVPMRGLAERVLLARFDEGLARDARNQRADRAGVPANKR